MGNQINMRLVHPRRRPQHDSTHCRHAHASPLLSTCTSVASSCLPVSRMSEAVCAFALFPAAENTCKCCVGVCRREGSGHRRHTKRRSFASREKTSTRLAREQQHRPQTLTSKYSVDTSCSLTRNGKTSKNKLQQRARAS